MAKTSRDVRRLVLRHPRLSLKASTGNDWRVVEGYGTLISHAMPRQVDLRLSTPVNSLDLAAKGAIVGTPFGAIRARSIILTVSTAVLAGSLMSLPPALDAWRHAASCLPLGGNEK